MRCHRMREGCVVLRKFKEAHGPKNKEDCRMFAPSCEVKSTDDIAWSRAFFRGDEAQPAIVCAGHQNHALALDAAQFARARG